MGQHWYTITEINSPLLQEQTLLIVALRWLYFHMLLQQFGATVTGRESNGMLWYQHHFIWIYYLLRFSSTCKSSKETYQIYKNIMCQTGKPANVASEVLLAFKFCFTWSCFLLPLITAQRAKERSCFHDMTIQIDYKILENVRKGAFSQI